MHEKRMAGLMLLVLLFTCPYSLQGNGVIRDGIGAISIGRGGTNIAFSDNTAILLDNPAGMVGLRDGSMFQISLDGLATDLHYQDPFGGDRNAFRPMGLPEIGFIQPVDDGVWAWGVALVAPAGFGTQFELSDPVFGNQNYSSFGALAKVLPGVACQVTDRLAVGATLGVGVSYANLDGPFYIQTGALAGAPTLVDIQGAGAALVWSFGMQYQVSDAMTIGACYQSESRFHLRGNAQVDILPLGMSSGFDSQLDLTWPSTFGFGFAYCLSECHRLSADVILVNWSQAFDSMGIHLSGATNPVVAGIVGPTVTDQFPFLWKDSLSVRTGYEYFVSPCLTLRTGYVYNTNQVPDGTLTPYVPAILEHAFSLGLGRTWDNVSVDLAYQYSFGTDRSVGTSDLVGGDFNNSVFQAQAHWAAVALTWLY